MIEPRILTVVLNYKTALMTLRAADAARVAMQALPGEILIVDNDSQDGSFEKMAAHVVAESWSNTRVIQSGRNGGYGAGNNAGIRAGMSDGSRPHYVYILNSDAFPDPDAIRVLYEHLNTNPNTGFVGSLLLDENAVQRTSAFRFPSIVAEFETSVRFGLVTKLLNSYRVPRELSQSTDVDWVTGASLMMRQSVLDKIGLFDEAFFLYFEETDLCRRAKKAGYRVMFLADSVVTHWEAVSTGKKEGKRVPDYWFASRWHYLTKNHGRAYAACATVSHQMGGGLYWLRCKLTGKTYGAPPHFLRTMAVHDITQLFKFRHGSTNCGLP